MDCCKALKVIFSEVSSFDVSFRDDTKFEIDFGETREIIPSPYEGEYEADPSFEEQIFRTAQKTMASDFKVNAIEVSRVSNPFGGKTIYIGGELIG